VLLCGIACLTSVPTGHTGVVSNFGKVANTTLDSGIHFKAPWTKVVKMDNRTQKASLEMACFSSDIQEVNVKYTVNYRIEKVNASLIYKNIGAKYYDTVITPCIQESLKTIVAKYTAEDLINSRAELSDNIETTLRDKLIAYNIELVDTSIEDMDFTDAFTKAVEDKQVAQQNKLKAQTQAEQKIIEAEAEAKAKLIRAEAEAKANDTISNSLTDDVLYQQWLAKWDGKLPTVAGSDANVIIGDMTGGK
jgi:regulator of protease activity HflC (stomatin/prohibitin superfamily)